MCVYIHMCVCVKRKSPTHTHMYKQLLVPCAAAHNPPAQKLKANFNYVLSTTTPRSLRFFFFLSFVSCLCHLSELSQSCCCCCCWACIIFGVVEFSCCCLVLHSACRLLLNSLLGCFAPKSIPSFADKTA